MSKKSRTGSNEIEDRKRCIILYNEDKNPSDIHKELHHTRNWVYKWIKRYKSGDPDWYLNESKEPNRKHAKIDESLENKIVEIQKKLMAHSISETKYSYYGAVAIHQELDIAGYNHKPNLSTINRVIKRNDLIKNKAKNKVNKESKIFSNSHKISFLFIFGLKTGIIIFTPLALNYICKSVFVFTHFCYSFSF